jgi:signal transduction histidine kinase/ActR/RegA family two-component response regulator
MISDRQLMVEHLRITLHNVQSTALPPIAVALVLVWVLLENGNQAWLGLWCATVVGCELVLVGYARHVLARGFAGPAAARVLWILAGLNLVNGASWGALVWITLDTATPVENILVNSILSGMAASAMTLFAPSLPVYVAFVVTIYATTASKFWQMDDPVYRVLLGTLTLYLVALLLQARNSSITVLNTIRLRFENAALVEQLRAETRKANAAEQEAIAATQAKTRFLAAASHDLRQPVHALGLFLEVLGRGELSAGQRAVLDSAGAAARASSDMLNKLLDISRIDAEAIDVPVRAFPLQALLHQLERERAPLAEAKGLVYRTRDTQEICESDPVLVELIIRNLVSNAIRHSHRGGLLVALRLRGQSAWIEVWDTGIGIDSNDFDAIFREFHQLHQHAHPPGDGLGLGLAIASRLARKLGHDLTVASRVGRGSVFRLRLPRSPSPGIVDQSPPAASTTRRLAAHILVLDDDPVVLAAMAQLLCSWGCTCDATENVEDAFAAVRQRVPDLFISDLITEDAGAPAIATIQAALSIAVPCILVTGETAPARLRAAQQSGMPLLHKPVSAEQLYQAVTRLLPQDIGHPQRAATGMALPGA